MKKRSAAFALASLLTGCSGGLTPQQSSQINVCNSDSDCGSRGHCVDATAWRPDAVAKMCVASVVDLADLLIQVTPPAGAEYGADLSFFVAPHGPFVGTVQTGFFPEREIELPSLVSAGSGVVTFGYDVCQGQGAKVPAVPDALTFQFSNVPPYAGLPVSQYTSTATPIGNTSSYGFGIDLPPGNYDVSIQSELPAGCQSATPAVSPPPPLFLPNQKLTLDTAFNVVVPEPLALTGTVKAAAGATVDKWLLQLVDSISGQPVSNIQTLDASGTIDVKFYWMEKARRPVIQLRPPDGVAKPSVYWDLGAVLTSSTNLQVDLVVADLQLKSRLVVGQVVDANGTPVVANVTLQSTSLSDGSVPNATYTTSIPTNPQGQFTRSVPPGKYTVRAVPMRDNGLSANAALWDITDEPSCYCGHAVTLRKQATLEGSLLAPGGSELPNMPLAAVPSPSDLATFLHTVLTTTGPQPRSTSSTTDGSGAFSFGVDPGTLTFSAQPVSDSGFAWLVLPAVDVPTGAKPPKPLGSLTMSSPAVLYGTLRAPGHIAVTNTPISAWLPLRDEAGDPTGTAIQIAASTTDETGRYVFYLPAAISK